MADHDYSKIPTFKDLGDPSYAGPRPNPPPHMSGHVPPPAPYAPPPPVSYPSWQPERISPRARSPSAKLATAPSSAPQPLSSLIGGFALWCAVGAALYAWLALDRAPAQIGLWAGGGAVLGAAAATVLWLLGHLIRLLVVVVTWLIKAAFVVLAVGLCGYALLHVFR